MKLNHLNLTVDDVQAARAFLEKHFGLRPYGEGQKNFDVLFDDDDLVLTLIGVRRSKQLSYPKTFHIGFIQRPRPTSTSSTAASARTAMTSSRRAGSTERGPSTSRRPAASPSKCSADDLRTLCTEAPR
jgi:catechol 2,3-dioxygenase-like lactoylglutathione lyase family enzyme